MYDNGNPTLCTVWCALLVFLLALAAPARAEVIDLSHVPSGSLGRHTDYLIENGQPLDLSAAMRKQAAGEFHTETQTVPNFGIGSQPVWLHLAIDNPTGVALERQLATGVTWLDHVDVMLVQSGKILSQFHTGDEIPHAPGLLPVVGFALPLNFAPGRNDLYIRVDSADPMPIPLELLDEEALEARQIHFGYFYGFFFGFLAALCAYNLLLYIGLRERSNLYYSLTLASLLLCNFAYTGHGVAWLWPDQPGFQRYIILVMMVLYNVMGLLFANRFLALAKFAPRISSAIKWFAWLGLLLISISSLSDSHTLAALIAFVWMCTFSTGMFMLGIMSVWRKQEAGRYFLLATFFGMLGIGSTAFAVWGKIPFGSVTFHAGEVGMMLEAALLALALAYRMRQYQDARYQAEQLAHKDVLTGLNNRRAFLEHAMPYIKTAERHQRPFSLIILDLDHFKSINDQYGHQAGDDALVAVSRLLQQYCRASDIFARWGGEEFMLLLIETGLSQAVNQAERLRQAIAEIQLPVGKQTISLTASFGVATHVRDISLDTMIAQADEQLYKAKKAGRNRVCSAADD